VLAFGFLTACDGPVPMDAGTKAKALAACERLLQAHFPQMTDGSYELRIGRLQFDDTKTWVGGEFGISSSDIRGQSNPAVVKCAGNVDTRTITQIEFDGDEQTPADGQRWSY
jgi:hypothetical protein